MLKTATDQFHDIHDGKFRKRRLHQVAPISTSLVPSLFAEQVLGLPRLF